MCVLEYVVVLCFSGFLILDFFCLFSSVSSMTIV